MLRKTALKEVPIGTTFEVWNRKFTVLNKDWQSNALVLAADVETRMAFREGDEVYAVAPNDFRDSTIRNWLNDDYLGELQEDGLKNGEILDMEIDLKCTLGQHEYGADKVKVGLLTLEQYGEYYGIIPKTDSSWWLATPWATPRRSPYTYNTYSVWSVSTSGGYSYYFCSNTYGVRPALTLSSSLLVAWDDGNEANVGWDAYIRYLHKWAVEHSDEDYAGSYPAAYQDFEEWAYSTKEERR